MASSYAKLPPAVKLDKKTSQPPYHDDDVCGSTFHGLASTLEKFAVANNVTKGLEQIDRCIAARRAELEKRRYPNAAHHTAIDTVIALRSQYVKLLTKAPDILKKVIVRFDDEYFNFFVGYSLGGVPHALDGGHRRKTRRRKRQTRSKH